jgi:hypothetical protein
MKISLREIFLVVVICAICLGWYQDHRQSQTEKEQLNADLQRQTVELNLMQARVYNLGRTRGVGK